jgi:hypothetical protein
MICCVIAACLVARIVFRARRYAKYLGFDPPRDPEERFGFVEHGELDVYKN